VSTCADGIIILSATKLGFSQHGFDGSSLVCGVELVDREARCGFDDFWVVGFDDEQFSVECDESVEVCVGEFCGEGIIWLGAFVCGFGLCGCFDLDGDDTVGCSAPEVGTYAVHVVDFDAVCFENVGRQELALAAEVCVVWQGFGPLGRFACKGNTMILCGVL